MELTTAIQSEHHVKKEIARRMGELQEELHNVKEQVRSGHCVDFLSSVAVNKDSNRNKTNNVFIQLFKFPFFST